MSTLIQKLYAVAIALNDWQKANAGRCAGRCLEAVRTCLQAVGLYLPRSNVDYEGDYAIQCGEYLAEHPVVEGKWRWKLLGTTAAAIPMDRPCLVFFRGCGKLANGNYAGHVAIVKMSTGHLIANETFEWSDGWANHVAFVFVPAEE